MDDGHGPDDLLHLVVEIKGYRRDPKEKKYTMGTYWVPGVNYLGTYGRWAFAEFTNIYQMQKDCEAKVEAELNLLDGPPRVSAVATAIVYTMAVYTSQEASCHEKHHPQRR